MSWLSLQCAKCMQENDGEIVLYKKIRNGNTFPCCETISLPRCMGQFAGKCIKKDEQKVIKGEV